jgi:hypothetical protein
MKECKIKDEKKALLKAYSDAIKHNNTFDVLAWKKKSSSNSGRAFLF